MRPVSVLSLATPLWLLGLLGLPVIWWLHRQSQRPHTYRVSAAWLWPEVSSSTGEVLAQPATDPRWWLRVAICTLFLVALSGMAAHLNSERPISVWLDDSLSMQTLEQGETRQELALRELRRQLGNAGTDRIVIHALSDHSNRITVASLDSARWQTDVRTLPIADEPTLPDFFAPDRDHWLVTDGADASLLGSGQFHNLLRLGDERTNTALTHVSVRPGLQHPAGPLVGIFTVTAFTDQSLLRTLRIQADGAEVATQELTLANGEFHGRFTLPRHTQQLELSLEPSDHLPLDDRLTLALTELNPVPVQIGAKCGAGLTDALTANPMLRVSTETRTQNPADLFVNCDDSAGLAMAAETGTAATRQVWVHRNPSSRTVTPPFRWHADAAEFNRLFLDGRMFSTGNYAGSGQVLLTAGPSQQPLVVRENGNTQVFVDLDTPDLVNDPAYPYLVTAIAQLAVSNNLVNPQSQISRNVTQSQVAPVQNIPSVTATHSGMSSIETDLTRVILSLLIALLLLDAAKTASPNSAVARWFRAPSPTTASPQ